MPPSAMFYNDILQPYAQNGKISWSGLPNPRLPLKFIGTDALEKSTDEKASWYNPGQINIVVDIIKSLLVDPRASDPSLRNSDISVMAPWWKQVWMMRKRLRNEGFSEVNVGTVEVRPWAFIFLSLVSFFSFLTLGCGVFSRFSRITKDVRAELLSSPVSGQIRVFWRRTRRRDWVFYSNGKGGPVLYLVCSKPWLMYTQNERGYHPSERANGGRWERCAPPARPVLEDIPAICGTERTVSIFYSFLPIHDLCAFCENSGLICFLCFSIP